MNKKKLKQILYLFFITCMLSGCSNTETYSHYTLGSKIKILGHAFHTMMFTLRMYEKFYAAILLLELIAILLSIYEPKKLKFFVHTFGYSILTVGFIMLFEPFLNTLKWIISIFSIS